MSCLTYVCPGFEPVMALESNNDQGQSPSLTTSLRTYIFLIVDKT